MILVRRRNDSVVLDYTPMGGCTPAVGDYILRTDVDPVKYYPVLRVIHPVLPNPGSPGAYYQADLMVIVGPSCTLRPVELPEY